MFRVTSDGGWSDGDCSYPTHGACQLDDVNITCPTARATPPTSRTAPWVTSPSASRSVWATSRKIWTGLEDVDPCNTDYTAQVAFIDDGVVVPGTGGTPCVNWCYGPAGFIVNTSGGLAGPDSHINDAVESPVLAWGDQANNGASFLFDAYRHEDLSADAPGIFYTWGVRSARRRR